MKFSRKIISAFLLTTAFLLLLQFYFSYSGSDIDKELPLKIDGASATCEGLGFENAISTSPNSKYVAGQKSEDVSYVEFRIEKPSEVEGIYIKWYSRSCFARTLEIVLFDEKNKVIGKVTDYEEERSLESIIKFNRVKGCKKIKLSFFDLAGDDRVFLKEIKVFEKLTQQTYEEQKIYLSARDTRNPLSKNRVPIMLKIKNLSDALSKGIEGDHDKVMSFMNYINTFSVGSPSNSSNLNTVVNEKIGLCGDFSNLLAALCASQNIKTRIIGMNYFTKQDSHVVVEAFIDGKWCLYDPTYGGYYRLRSNTSELPLNLAEIIKIYKNEPELIEFVHTLRRNSLDVYTGKDIYLNSDPIGPIGLDKPMFYHLSLKVGDKLVKLVYVYRNKVYNQGSNVIGANSTNINHIWTLNGLSKGKKYEFIIFPKTLQKENTVQNVFILKASYLEGGHLNLLEHEFKFENNKTEPWIIKFKAESEKIEMKLFHDYKGPDLFYMSMDSYELREELSGLGNNEVSLKQK